MAVEKYRKNKGKDPRQKIKYSIKASREGFLNWADINSVTNSGFLNAVGDPEYAVQASQKYNRLLQTALAELHSPDEILKFLDKQEDKLKLKIIDAGISDNKVHIAFCQKLIDTIIAPTRNVIFNRQENVQLANLSKKKKKGLTANTLETGQANTLNYMCLQIYLDQLIRYCVNRGYFNEPFDVVKEAFRTVNHKGGRKVIWHSGKNYFIDMVYQMSDETKPYCMVKNLQKHLVEWITLGFTTAAKAPGETSDFTPEYTRKLLVNDTYGADKRPSTGARNKIDLSKIFTEKIPRI